MSKISQLRNRHVFLSDLLLILLTPTLALAIRLETISLPETFIQGLIVYTLLSLLLRPVTFYLFNLYRRYWRYASVDELFQIGKAVLTSSLLTFTVTWIIVTATSLQFARSVFIIDTLLILAGVGLTRFFIRFQASHQLAHSQLNGRKTLIIGAGDTGAMVLRELQRNNQQVKLCPVGFLDDNEHKLNMTIHDLPVLGKTTDLERLVQQLDITYVIIAMPSATGKTVRSILKLCEAVKVETKIVPAMYELLNGSLTVNQLRDVNIEDLLRRDPIQTDTAAVNHLVMGKRVLVTGGGGSIGSELCRQLLRFHPEELLILDHGENPIFEIMQELKQMKIAGSKITSIVADIRHASRIKHVFETHRPQLVFHAAAHKHVRFMEWHPAEAVTNNVYGTRNIVQASLAFDVEHFVMISTDKAVNPTSVMGVSKRAAELLVHQAAAESGRPYVAVRFGNVLGSRGSVVLTFKQQIAAGGPITVTHPDMKRFFMTIPEAVQLVLQAAVLGQGNEVYVLDMGNPVKIVDLARDMIELSGLKLGQDIDIEFIGKLPGEKLFEELFIPGEEYHRTKHHKVFIAGNASSFAPHDLEDAIDALIHSAQREDNEAILRGFKSLVPEFNHSIPEAITIQEKEKPAQIPILTAISSPDPVKIR